MGGSRRPPACSARRRPARMTVSVIPAISGDAADRDSVIRYSVSRVAGEPGRVEARQAGVPGRGDPGHDLRVVQALGRGPGRLVDPVPGLRGAHLRAAQRRGQRRVPGVVQQLGGGGRGRVVQPAGHRVQRAAARRRRPAAGWSAVPGRPAPRCPSCVLSSMVSTKWPASRWAASTLVSPASRLTQNRCPAAVIACGSNVQIREPDAARSSAVAAHRSALTLVATTGPGADSTYGMPSEVVLPTAGPEEGEQGVFPGGEQLRAVPAGLLEPAEQQPDVGRGQAAGPGAGQRGPQPDALLGGRGLRELADGPVPAERGDRVAGPGGAPGDDPPRDDRDCGQHGGQDGAGHGDQGRGDAGPRLRGAAVEQGRDPADAERRDCGRRPRRRRAGRRPRPARPGRPGPRR